jgi:hypothetical protein
MGSGMAGLTVGGIQGLLSHDMQAGLMAGLSAYGGASLGGGLSSLLEGTGSEAIGSSAVSDASNQAIANGLTPTADELISAKTAAIGEATKRDMFDAGLKAAAGNPLDFMSEHGGDFLSKNWKALGAAALPIMMANEKEQGGLPSLAAPSGRFQFGHWNSDGTYTRTGSRPVSEGYPTGMAQGGYVGYADGGVTDAEIDQFLAWQKTQTNPLTGGLVAPMGREQAIAEIERQNRRAALNPAVGDSPWSDAGQAAQAELDKRVAERDAAVAQDTSPFVTVGGAKPVIAQQQDITQTLPNTNQTSNTQSDTDAWTGRDDPNRLRTIAGGWNDTNKSMADHMDEMSKFGVNAEDIAKATGKTLEQIAQQLRAGGAKEGFAGLHWNADGSFYGSDESGPWKGQTQSTLSPSHPLNNSHSQWGVSAVQNWQDMINNGTRPILNPATGNDTMDVYAYLMGKGKNPFTQNAKWKGTGAADRKLPDAVNQSQKAAQKLKDDAAKAGAAAPSNAPSAPDNSGVRGGGGARNSGSRAGGYGGVGHDPGEGGNYGDGNSNNGGIGHAPGEGGEGYAAGGFASFATGGLGSLGSFSDGGRLLRGPGDGVSDSIPATIGNGQPARLADGEFVIPARIVSELGNGSTEAGARKLYKMMARVQANRAKTIGKNRTAVNSKSDKFLPA